MATKSKPQIQAVEIVDTSHLETLLGYNARRATLAIIEGFIEHMGVHKLRPVEFSVLALIGHNPGITSRQLCACLGIQPPNLVGLVNIFETRGCIKREPHPKDGRAIGLHLTAAGQALRRGAERTAAESERKVSARLSAGELKTLVSLLKKLYQPSGAVT